MRRALRYFLPRLAISFGLVAGIFFFVEFLPEYYAERALEGHLARSGENERVLKAAQIRLQILTDPTTITPQKAGEAKSYASQVSDAIGVIDPDFYTIREPTWNPFGDDQISALNRLAEDPAYHRTFEEANQALEQAQRFIIYHAAVMKALTNLIQYDPAADLSPPGPIALGQRLEAASTGLERTIQRLREAPEYPDPERERLVEIVRSLQSEREKLTSRPPNVAAGDRSAFDGAVSAAQREILASRTRFWQNEQPKHLERLKRAERQRAPHAAKLRNLRID